MPKPRIPTEILKLKNTYRTDRHGDRADTSPPKGEPLKPDHFGPDETAIWEAVLKQYRGTQVLGEIDTAELIACCEQWGLYRQCVALAKENPIDKEIRCAVTAYLTAFDRLAAKFGMTSHDRAALKVPTQGSNKPTVPTRQRA